MQLLWGVVPIVVKDSSSVGKLLDNAITSALEHNLIQHGNIIVITGGIPFKISGSTNMLKIHRVGDIHLRGTGIGRQTVSAKVSIIENAQDLNNFPTGNILACYSTDNSMLEVISKAAGIITEKHGLTSHAAIMGREHNLPVIIGVKRCLKKLSENQIITMNCEHGQIYRGPTRER